MEQPTGQALIALAQSDDNIIIVNAAANAGYGAAEIAEALRRANAAAALSVTRKGAAESSPLRTEVDALLLERQAD